MCLQTTWHIMSVRGNSNIYWTLCRESLVTRLLQEQFGGNCRTRVLMSLSPFTSPSATSELFELAGNLSKVKNFPLLNEAFAQVWFGFLFFGIRIFFTNLIEILHMDKKCLRLESNGNQSFVILHWVWLSPCVFCWQQLLTQYRAQIIGLRHQLNPANVNLHGSLDKELLKNVEAENVCHAVFVCLCIVFSYFWLLWLSGSLVNTMNWWVWLICHVTCLQPMYFNW